MKSPLFKLFVISTNATGDEKLGIAAGVLAVSGIGIQNSGELLSAIEREGLRREKYPSLLSANPHSNP